MVRINPKTTKSKPGEAKGPTAKALQAAFKAQRDAFDAAPYPSWEVRKARLETLRDVLRKYEDDIKQTISDDFGHRSKVDTDLGDIIMAYNDIHNALKMTPKWMKRRKRATSLSYKPGWNEIIPQPMGVIGIVVPWNYPLGLATGPIIGAIGAGNRCMVKMSEYTPKFSALFKSMMEEVFEPDVVYVATGGVDVATAFTNLPFDHMLFTGSTNVGKIVAKAAAENLVPCTLELGGKSPVLIDDSAKLDLTVARIAQSKLLNAGQTCIAPDYVLMPKARIDAFSDAMINQAEAMYPKFAGNDDYTSVIADSHYARLQTLLEDAENKGAKIRVAGNDDKQQLAKERRIPLTVVTETTPDMKIMQEEIFGPLLPIVPSETLEDQCTAVKSKDRPLALYWFGEDDAKRDRVLYETHAGGVTINDCAWHFGQEDIGFGGIGPSGMGAYHGEAGFETFSHMKGVFHQSTGGLFHTLKQKMMADMMPPYTEGTQKMLARVKGMAGIK